MLSILNNKKQLKILMPVLHYKPVIGGFEIFIQKIAEEVGKTDEVFVVTGRVRGMPSYEKINNLRVIRTSPFALNDLSRTSFFYILSAMPWLFFKSAAIIKREGINLMHCHSFFSGILGWNLSLIFKIPYIMTIQSADFDVYHPKAKYFWFAKKKIAKKIYASAAKCHSVSLALKKHFESLGIKDSIVIPNGVDLKMFNNVHPAAGLKEWLGINGGDKVVITVSRLVPKNGIDDLIKAMRVLNDSRVKLLIVGNGEDRNKLENLRKKLNLEKQVIFLGDVVNTEIPKYLAIADIFVRPSLAEGFGIVFLEAMAARVAVIGTPVGGITDFLKDKETGLFCQPKNPESIAEKIQILLGNNNLRDKLTENGYKLAREEYDWGRIVERIRGIYEEIARKER